MIVSDHTVVPALETPVQKYLGCLWKETLPEMCDEARILSYQDLINHLRFMAQPSPAILMSKGKLNRTPGGWTK